MFAWIALIAFWSVAIYLWIMEGPKIPVVFMTLWIVGFLAFPRLGWPGVLFMSYEAVLAVILIVIAKYKSAMP